MIYVTDDDKLLPASHSHTQQVEHSEAARELRGKQWQWWMEDETSVNGDRLRALARDSGVTMDGDSLRERKLPSRDHLRVGGSEDRYLIVTSASRDYSWRTATPTAKGKK